MPQTLTYSIDDTSKVTGICKTKLYEAIRKGELKAKKFGRRTMILRSDLESFLTNLPEMGGDSNAK